MTVYNDRYVERFLRKFIERIAFGPGCWVWTGAKRKGYGRWHVRHRSVGAHRLAYMLIVGAIPAGMQIDHLCRNPACVNPTHMEVVDNRTNTLRGFSPAAIGARRSRCIHGHPFDSGNTKYVVEKRRGTLRTKRVCRMCRARIERQKPRRTRHGN